MYGNWKVMAYISRLITLLPLISAFVVAQTKVQVCAKYKTAPIVKNPLSLHAISEQPPLNQNGIKLVRRYDIDLKHIVPPPDFGANGTIADAEKVNMLPSLRLKSLFPSLRSEESFLVCMMGDLYPNGGIRLHGPPVPPVVGLPVVK